MLDILGGSHLLLSPIGEFIFLYPVYVVRHLDLPEIRNHNFVYQLPSLL